jgi:protein gp37
MGYPTKIEWTDATWNPIGGCSIKSPACVPCYAQKLAGTRLKDHPLYAGTTDVVKGKHVFNGKLTAAPDGHAVWSWPVRWGGAKQPKLGAGMPSTIFVGDMSDLFHEKRVIGTIDKTVAAILHSRHIGQLLTKRPHVMYRYFAALRRTHDWFLFNHPLFGMPNFAVEATFENAVVRRFWLGTSTERQREFDERWPWLRRLAEMGFTIFISYEPALGPLVLPPDFLALGQRAQVIAGGMSDEDYAPAHPDWFRSVRDQCAAAGVLFFFKQWGEWAPAAAVGHEPQDARYGEFHSGVDWVDSCMCNEGDGALFRVGKKRAGRLLDGVEHNGFPAIAR